MLKHYTYILLWMLLAGACGGHAGRLLERVERTIDMQPDSAYTSLLQIDPDGLSRAERALYVLLLTEAEDKLYLPHTADSLVGEAYLYFKKSADLPRQAKALYLSGRIHADREQWEEATQKFLQAHTLAAGSGNDALRGRIANQMGNVNFQNRLYDASQSYYREAYGCFVREKDSVNIAYALQNIGSTFLPEEKPDSIVHYYWEALRIARETRNDRLLSSVKNQLGYVYINMQRYDEALACLREAIAIAPYTPYRIYADVGKLYTQIGPADSAKYYLAKALESPDLPTRYMGYKYLGQIARQEQDLEASLRYKDLQEQLRDSINQSKSVEPVVTVQQQHRQLADQHRHRTELWRLTLFYGGICLVMGVPAVYLLLFWYRKYRWGQRKLLLYKKQRLEGVKQIRANIRQIDQYNASIHDYEEQIRQADMRWKQMLEHSLEETRQIDRWKAEIQSLQAKNRQLAEHLYTLALQECRQHPALKPLYDYRQPHPAFSASQWKSFGQAFDRIFPGYCAAFEQSYPDMSTTHRRLCYLLLLELKNARIAELMELQSDTLSVYKNNIKKKYFAPSGKISLEALLREKLMAYLSN